ncbi:HDA9 [Scenedesmus sp. PABB004]|nr:HDA9 [Scenedesmus sp. PABB004]
MSGERKRKVAYFYDSEFSTFYFGQNHPMKPHRLTMTHQLVLGYDLHKHMDVFRAVKALPAQLGQFHSAEYVDFLSSVTPDNMAEPAHAAAMGRHNFNEDCPVFDGLFEYCRLYAGASIQGAVRLNHGLCDTAINWSGGLHHAKKGEASGFCYVNDLVLAILELLKYHARVLYLDIDIHHGDGVEEAFYLSDRVMTVSFHKYGDYFFPGTGDLKDVGEQRGRYYTLNVPLKDGTDDRTFHGLFKPIMAKVMETFQPGAVVMQCGADSLANDRLGCFNLSMKGHGEAVSFMKGFGVPMLVTGGGGYTKHNVARCWTYETALLVGARVHEELPETHYHEYFAPDYSLNVAAHRVMDDCNKKDYVERMRVEVLENLRHLGAAPGVQFAEVPPDAMLPEYELPDGPGPPEGGGFMERLGRYAQEHSIIKEGEPHERDAWGD